MKRTHAALQPALAWLALFLCVVTANAQFATLPFEVTNNNIFVQVRVNDSAPLWFMFDTGAGQTMIDVRRVEELNLNTKGAFEAVSGGAKSRTGTFLEGATMTFPSVSGFHHPLRRAVSFEQLEPLLGRRVDGLLGYDFIRQFVVEVDFVQEQLRLHDPDNFTYTGDGASLPLTFKVNHPHVRATIRPGDGEPIEADCLLDLGASMPLLLARPFVERHRLLERSLKSLEPMPARGSNGDVKLRVTRISQFRLGPYEFHQPLVWLSQDTEGALGWNASFEINIGSGLLRRFRVFFDYQHARLILEPNARLAEPFEFDMSGIALQAEGEAFRIWIIHTNTPATQAGLQVGDLLESVDNKPAQQLGLTAVRRLLMTEGTRRLTLRRGTQTLRVSLRLKRRI